MLASNTIDANIIWMKTIEAFDSRVTFSAIQLHGLAQLSYLFYHFSCNDRMSLFLICCCNSISREFQLHALIIVPVTGIFIISTVVILLNLHFPFNFDNNSLINTFSLVTKWVATPACLTSSPFNLSPKSTWITLYQNKLVNTKEISGCKENLYSRFPFGHTVTGIFGSVSHDWLWWLKLKLK